MDLAEKGDRRNVDLLVKDTAGSQYNIAPPEGMVSSFGKPAKDLFYETGNWPLLPQFQYKKSTGRRCFL